MNITFNQQEKPVSPGMVFAESVVFAEMNGGILSNFLMYIISKVSN
jgi:hypothetical protein